MSVVLFVNKVTLNIKYSFEHRTTFL